MSGIALVLSNTPRAVARRFGFAYAGIQVAAKATKIRNSFVVPKYELPDCVKQNKND